MVPGRPALWSPGRGAYTGSPTASGSLMTLRPTFVWHAPAGCVADTFELQVDNSCVPGQLAACTFPTPEIATTVPATTTRFTPSAALAVQTTAPVGAIYAWRVRACAGASGCGAWSEVGYLNVGRVTNDINGDGYADLIAQSTERTTFTYRLEIYAGSATPGTTAPVHLGGAPLGGVQYVAPSFIGDVNGDGFGDFVCWRQDTAPMMKNVPVFFLGGPNLSSLTSVAFTSYQTDYGSPSSFSNGGDFNGDGFSDVAASFTPGISTTQLGFYVFLGAATFAAKAPELMTLGPPAASLSSDSSRTVGDVNGDGFSDIGLFHQSLGSGGATLRIFLGGSSPDVSSDGDVTLTDLATLADPSGDVDGDGYDDIVLNSGGYGLLRGGPTLPNSYAPIGASLVLISGFDINGDGKTDLLLRDAPGLILGGATLTPMAGLTPLTGNSQTRSLTWADYNGDGRTDFAEGDSSTGQVLLFLNDGTLNPTPTAPLPGPAVSPYVSTGAIARGH